ncbi:MAG: hypothetical protein ACLFR1_07725 [Spirochaetia bacterium]
MKKTIMLTALIFVLIFSAFSQSESTLFEARTDNYLVYSEISAENASNIAETLEGLLSLYNSYFHFDLSEREIPFKVRMFATKDRYDSYLQSVINQTREDFTYLHYSSPERSELLLYSMGEDFEVSLAHHGFIQFIKSFVSNPPLWMRVGFAVYFERADYDTETDQMVFLENLAWIETLKEAIANEETSLISLESLLQMTPAQANEQINLFYPQSWALVSFLLNSDNTQYNRILWDAVHNLQARATLAVNSQHIVSNAFSWVNMEQLETDYLQYINSRMSYRELVQAGVREYNEEDYETALKHFTDARSLEPSRPVPYYYLGLLNYNTGNYIRAEEYFQSALEYGADGGAVYYALGVNAFADNQYDLARTYLENAIGEDPETYQDKAQSIYDRMEAAN